MRTWPQWLSWRKTEERFGETPWSIVVAAGADDRAAGAGGIVGVVPHLLATNLRVPPAQRLRHARRAGPDPIIFPAPPRKRNVGARLARKRPLPQFPPWCAQALSGRRAGAAAHLKRGGGVQFVSANELEAEELHHLRADYEAAPDEILDARWAGVLLERALEKVRLEFDAQEKAKTFQLLSPFLAGEKPTTSYEEVAKDLGISLGAVKTQIHRLRRRFAAAVRSEIMQTVAAPHEVENELRQLRDVFARVGEQQAL